MSLFTFHLAKITVASTLKTYLNPPDAAHIAGLVHGEYFTAMTLGAPVISPARLLLRQVAFFAQWENEEAIDRFLEDDPFGKLLQKGWHTRLVFLRQWGKVDALLMPEAVNDTDDPDTPVVAFTLARMKLSQVPRFVRWGRPVEKLVRDHPGISFAMAAIRLPRTVSTFSIWKSRKEMVDMVRGHSAVAQPERHAAAMRERERKDFHFEFTTLRFKPVAEYGSWAGRTNIIPGLNNR